MQTRIGSWSRWCGAVAVLGLCGVAQAQTFVEKWRITTGGPANSASLNDHGVAVWTTRLDGANNAFLYDGVTLLPLGVQGADNQTIRININHWAVWAARHDPTDPISAKDLYLWKPNGGVINITNSTLGYGSPTLNSLNDIVWTGKTALGDDDLFYKQHGLPDILNMTRGDATGNSTGPVLNDNGMLSWERISGISRGDLVYAPLASVIEAGKNNAQPQFSNASGSGDPNVINGGMNQAGFIVWHEYNDNRPGFDVWIYDPITKTRTNLSATLGGNNYRPVILEDGTVLFEHWPGGRSRLYWYRGTMPPTEMPIDQTGTFNRTIAINRTGGLLYASGSGSAYRMILLQMEQTTAAVTGFIALQDIVPQAKGQEITFTFRPVGGGANIVRTAQIAPEGGGFALSNLPKGEFTLHISGRKWLSRNVSVNTTGGNVHNVQLTLLPGEIVQDGNVDLFDLVAFFDAYGSSEGDADWNDLADCNCDGAVDLFDLVSLFNSYGESGDE